MSKFRDSYEFWPAIRAISGTMLFLILLWFFVNNIIMPSFYEVTALGIYTGIITAILLLLTLGFTLINYGDWIA